MTQYEYEIKRQAMGDKITGCAFASYNYWHAGVDELVYEAGLCCELEDAVYSCLSSLGLCKVRN